MTDPLPPSDWLKLMLEEIGQRRAEEAAAAQERERRGTREEESAGEDAPPSGDVSQELGG